jgi:hypothetical protein
MALPLAVAEIYKKILTNQVLAICTPGNRPLGGVYLRAWYGTKP